MPKNNTHNRFAHFRKRFLSPTPLLGRYLMQATLIFFVAGIVTGYAIFRSHDLAQGPVITVAHPSSGDTRNTPLVTISGTAKNISFITLNDREIFTDEEGHFSEQLLLHEGYNAIKVSVRDRFGRERTEVLETVFRKDNTLTRIETEDSIAFDQKERYQ